MTELKHCTHGFGPFYDSESIVLILGSFPSVKSREETFYYAHPQNRFWKVLASISGEMIPNSLQEKKDFLTRNNIALWDVIEECDIKGSSDSSIVNVVYTDLNGLLDQSKINKIIINGRTAEKYLKKSNYAFNGKIIVCPSTSAANAAMRLDQLIDLYKHAFE